MIAALKSASRKVSYCSPGLGTTIHPTIKLLESMAGEVSMVIVSPLDIVPQARAGKRRVLAVTSKRRYPKLADTPAVRCGSQGLWRKHRKWPCRPCWHACRDREAPRLGDATCFAVAPRQANGATHRGRSHRVHAAGANTRRRNEIETLGEYRAHSPCQATVIQRITSLLAIDDHGASLRPKLNRFMRLARARQRKNR